MAALRPAKDAQGDLVALPDRLKRGPTSEVDRWLRAFLEGTRLPRRHLVKESEQVTTSLDLWHSPPPLLMAARTFLSSFYRARIPSHPALSVEYYR